MKTNIALILSLFISITSIAQEQLERPTLVVGIVVDQMRQEYLYRFVNKYGEGGFKRLMNQGFMLSNAHYNYAPTYTGPGHASVYTGTTPSIHGIIGNDFYNKTAKQSVNCVGDSNYLPVGSKDGNGDVSPFRMLSSTVTDELRLSSQKKSKVISISIKDRGAVLPAGHTPNAAYWFDGKNGIFMSSTYYMTKLPEWVSKFNDRGLPDKYLSQEWNTILPIAQYTESGPDDSPYESKYVGKTKSVFPYNLNEIKKKNGGYDLFVGTPFAQDYITEFVKTAIDAEQLGKDEWSDFLTISYSTPDIIGHNMGPNAVEVEDTYIRLDRNIEDLLKTLDKDVGEGKYVVFLTADHAVAEVPQYLRDNKIPAGYFNSNTMQANLNEFLAKYFPEKKIIEYIGNNQVYLNQEAFSGSPKTAGIDMLVATQLISKYIMSVEGVANVYTESVIQQASYSEEGTRGMIVRGFNPKRSGDLAYVLEPGWLESGRVQGSTHGSTYTYDTHVPMLFYGFGISHGTSVRYHPITDIAPTISILLKIRFPSGCTGQPIEEVLKTK